MELLMKSAADITNAERLPVLHLGAGVIHGGVEAFLASLAVHSRRTIPSFALCAEGRLANEARAAGRTVHVLPQVRLSRPLWILRARRALDAVLATSTPAMALIHSGWMQVLFGPVLSRRRIPTATWIHGIATSQPWLEWLARRHRPVRIFTASHFMAEQTAGWYPGTPRSVVHIPVAAPDRIGPADRLALRRSLDTGAEEVVVVVSCRFEPWKGHDILFRALGILGKVPGWNLWVAGGAQEDHEMRRLESLRELGRDLGIGDRIRFLGQRTDIPTVLQAADIHCQPNSGPEPFGIAFIEALYAGIPVVSTSIGGAREIVDGSCGVLVPTSDPQALALAIGDLIRDPARRKSLGEAGRRRAFNLCDPPRQVARLEEILCGSVPGGHGTPPP